MRDEQFGKYKPAIWAEYGDKIINELNLKQTAKGEFHGACPSCGGTDRFWIKEQAGEVKVFCRQCDDFPAITNELRNRRLWPEIAQDTGPAPVRDLRDFDDHTPYHIRKGVDLGTATLEGNNVVIPVIDASGKKIGKQTITPDGTKRFTVGMAKEGAFGPIGGALEGTCYIAEGWATAASVSASTGRPAVFALDSGNLPKVAAILQKIRPDAKFIIAADNDEPGIKAAKETGLPWAAPKRPGDDWNDVMRNLGHLAVKKGLESAKQKKALFVPIGDLEFSKPKWIIQGWLEQETFAVAFGKPAAGKTFVVLDMALCVAAGKDFHSRPVKQGPVFYIAGEGHNGFARRAAAWSKANETSLKDLPFFKSNRNIVMTDPTSVAELHDTIEEMAAEFGKPELIVVDTLARAMGSADENSTQEMGAFIRTIDDIRDDFGCTFLAVHHTGHGNQDRARGSSSLLGAVDAEMRIEKKENEAGSIVLVECTKMKDAQEPDPQAFIHRTVDLIDADLEPTSSVVLEPIEYNSDAEKEGATAKWERMVLDELRALREANPSTEGFKKSDICRVLSERTGKSQKTFIRTVRTLLDNESVRELSNNSSYIQEMGH